MIYRGAFDKIRAMRLLLSLAIAAGLHAQSISTLIGTGKPGFDEHSVNNPYGMALGPDGALYFCDIDNHAVRRIDLKTRKMTTVAGTGVKGNSGDGGPATHAQLNQPYEVQFDAAGNLFIDDMPSSSIRRVDAKTGIITTVAGPEAQLKQPHSIAFDSAGRLLVCDIGNNRVRRIDLKTGMIETWLSDVNGPRAIGHAPDGNLYLVLREGNMVLKIDAKTGASTRVAGTGQKGFTGDGGPALEATFNGPKGIAVAPDGTVYLADTENHAIRRIDGKTGVVSTLAGTGKRGDGPGDGGDDSVGGADPRGCSMSRPHGVLVGLDGTIYIADSEAHRIRMVR